MIGKTRVVTAVLGLVLSASDLRAEGFDLFYYKNHTPGFSKFCEHIARLSNLHILSHWGACAEGKEELCDSVYYSMYLQGVSAEVEQVVKDGTEGAKTVRRYLQFLTGPRFARVFFPRGLKKKNGMLGESGRLRCSVVQKKLKKDSPAFVDFGKYTLWFVKYEEVFSGCFFEMVYCFETDGTFAGWYPTRLMAEWMARIRQGRFPDEEERVTVCQMFSNFGDRVTHTLGVKDFE